MADIPITVGGGVSLFHDTTAERIKIRGLAGGDAFVTSDVAFSGINDVRILADGTTTNGSRAFSSASANFTAADVGKVVLIVGAGAAGADLATTISSITSSAQAQLAVAAGATLSGITWAFGTDNTTNFTSALTAINGIGRTLVVTPGQYMFGGVIDFSLLSNLAISGYGATFIVAKPGSTNNFFGGGSTIGSDITLAANVAANQRTFTVTPGAPISVGQTVLLNSVELGGLYKVLTVSGSSPQTVTVDREILFPYFPAQAGHVNIVTSLITGICIQGLTFCGSCDQYIKIRSVTNSILRDCKFLPTVSFAGQLAFLLSEYSYNWQVDNCTVNGPVGAGMASTEDCWVTKYTYNGTPNPPIAQAGFQMLDCASGGLENFSISCAGGSGVVIDQIASIAGTPFTVGVTVSNGTIGGCGVNGVSDNGWYTTVNNVLIVNNVACGVALNASAEGPKVRGCRILNNGSVGISNSSGIATGTAATIVDCEIVAGGFDVTTNASCILSQGPLLFVTSCQLYGLAAATGRNNMVWSDQGFTFGCKVIVENCDFLVQGTSTGSAVIQQTANPFSVMRNCRLRFNGGAGFVGSGINNLNGRMQLDSIETVLLSSTVPGQGLATAAGSLTRIGPNCNFDGCTTPVSMGGFCSRSINGSANANSVTLNGTTPVNYGFTDTKSTDRVQLILRTRGGTPGNGAVLVAITAGTGVSLAGNGAGVNDVYDLVIG